MALTKMPLLMLFLSKTVFTRKLSQLLCEAYRIFERKVPGIDYMRQAARECMGIGYCSWKQNQDLLK